MVPDIGARKPEIGVGLWKMRHRIREPAGNAATIVAIGKTALRVGYQH